MTPTTEHQTAPVIDCTSSGGVLAGAATILPVVAPLSSCGERRFTPARPTSPALSGVGALYPAKPYPLDALGFLAAAGRADNAQATTPRTAPDNSGYASVEVFHSQVAA